MSVCSSCLQIGVMSLSDISHTYSFWRKFPWFVYIDMWLCTVLQMDCKVKPFFDCCLSFMGFSSDEQKHMEDLTVENGNDRTQYAGTVAVRKLNLRNFMLFCWKTCFWNWATPICKWCKVLREFPIYLQCFHLSGGTHRPVGSEEATHLVVEEVTVKELPTDITLPSLIVRREVCTSGLWGILT